MNDPFRGAAEGRPSGLWRNIDDAISSVATNADSSPLQRSAHSAALLRIAASGLQQRTDGSGFAFRIIPFVNDPGQL
jgi:hypothetical protein